MKKVKKVLYIATVANKRNRLDGETIKNRLFLNYLIDIDSIYVYSVDTDDWKKHILKISLFILIHLMRCDNIIISTADRGAYIALRFFNMIKIKKPIYYFVIGGNLQKKIVEKKWNIEIYKNIKEIYVESDILRKDLLKMGLINVKKINNFRLPSKFKDSYKKTNNLKFVYFGRVIKEKGVENAINLIKRLNKENYKCSLDIYGQCTASYLKEINSMFSDDISYQGEIAPNNKIEYEILSKYDCFIFPTEYPGECLPGALIDAYISGLAVLVSNWKYANEYVENKKNGYIFKYRDYEDMYKKAKLLFNDRRVHEFKCVSKKLSKKYIIDKVLYEFKNNIG